MSSITKALPTYLLLALRGLELLVEKEIRTKLKVGAYACVMSALSLHVFHMCANIEFAFGNGWMQVEYLEICSVENDPKRPHVNVMQGEAAVGRILLRTTSSPEEVMQLQSVQAVLSFLVKSDDVITDAMEGTVQIGNMLADADWEPALQLWRAHSPRATETPKFRGSCVRDGRHKYKSVDVAGVIGEKVIDKFGWQVGLTDFDMEIVCILFQDSMIAGISLADPAKIKFKSRLANEDRAALGVDVDYISTLRPSTTYLMFQLAEYQLGEVFLDSMCGVGTIPVCCAEFSGNRVFALGGELDDLPVGKAGQNAAARPRNVGIMQWDSTRLPLRSDSIDKVMIDMPFGVRCGNHRLNNKMYPKIMKELLRVLRVGGRAVLLVIAKNLFLSSIQHLSLLRVVQDYEVNIGGIRGDIFILEKQ